VGLGHQPGLGVAEAVNDLLRRWVGAAAGASYDAVESARTDVLSLADQIRAARNAPTTAGSDPYCSVCPQPVLLATAAGQL
jgi:hypothetical protein